MRLTVAGREVDTSGLRLLGEGGEAQVFAWGDRALKVWTATQAHRWPHLRRLPGGLPSALVLPEHAALDDRGEVRGFTMQRVDALGDMRSLSRPAWRKAQGFDRGRVRQLFGRLLHVLEGCHRRGLVLGDLNEGNVLVTGSGPRLIDVDSAQFGGRPCPVGHERFLAPELYGLDLAAGPAFSPETDHYALAVMLFQALLNVHPFGGVHPACTSLTLRAEARISALSPGVKLPPLAGDPESVPEPLLRWLRAVFERDLRGPPPPDLLAMSWEPPTRAQACVQVGATRSSVLARTSGLFLEVQHRGGLRHLRWEEGLLLREDGQRLLECERPGALEGLIDGERTWLAMGERVREMKPSGPGRAMQTSTFLGRPQLALGPQGAMVLDQGQVLDALGRRHGRASPGRSWLAHGPTFGLLLSRYGLLTTLALLRRGPRPVRLPPIEGALLDLDATFDRSSVLLGLRLEHHGQRRVMRLLLDDQGQVLATSLAAEDSQAEHSWVPTALRGRRPLLASPDGLLELRPRRGALVPARLVPDSRDLLQGARRLLLTPDGAASLVTNHEIRRISTS